MNLPILYTFRRCPYAIRTRMTLAYTAVVYELREVLLKAMPQAMLDISPKATVPVLQQPDQTVLEESLDIIHWALRQNDPEGWLDFDANTLSHINALIVENDFSFKQHLDHYKYSERHPEQSKVAYREAGEVFLRILESLLHQNRFLFGKRISLADIAVFPFIRQFAYVDWAWFQNSSYTRLNQWLQYHLESELFACVMKKCKPWKMGDPVMIFTVDESSVLGEASARRLSS